MKKKILQRSLALGALMTFAITGSAWANDLTVDKITGNIDIDGTLYTTGYTGVKEGIEIIVGNISSADTYHFRSDMYGTINAKGDIHASGINAQGSGIITAQNVYLYKKDDGALGSLTIKNNGAIINESISGEGSISLVSASTLTVKSINVTGKVAINPNSGGIFEVKNDVIAGENIQNEGGTLTIGGNAITQAKFYNTRANTNVTGDVKANIVTVDYNSNVKVGSLAGLNGAPIEKVSLGNNSVLIIDNGELYVKDLDLRANIKQSEDDEKNSLTKLTVTNSLSNGNSLVVDDFNITGKISNNGELTVDKIGDVDNTVVIANSQGKSVTVQGNAYFSSVSNNGTIDIAGKAVLSGGWDQLAMKEDAVFKATDLDFKVGTVGYGTLEVSDTMTVNGLCTVETNNISVNNLVINNSAQMQLRDQAKNVTFDKVTLNDGSIQAYNNNTLTINELNSVIGKIQAWGQNKDELTTINIGTLNIGENNEFRANNYSGIDSVLNITEMNLSNGAAFYNVDRINYDGKTEPNKGVAFKAMGVQNVNSNGGAIINNGEMKIATTSGSNLTIQHDTLDDKVSIGRNEIEKLSVVSSSDNVGEDVQTGMQAIADTVAIAEGNKVKTVYAQAGDIYGDIMGITDNNGILVVSDEYVNQFNQGISEMASISLMTWRQENNDMNKRLGELRDSTGEHGVWVRMTRGESKYGNQSIKNQYNAYQLGYDEKLSVDKNWTLGAALTYTDAESSFRNGKGENKHKGLAIYGSRLNDDGSFIDLIAKYARLEHEFDVNGGAGKGDCDTNGYSLSAEYGKRFTKDNGLWIEPQVELTYGRVSGGEYLTNNGVKVRQEGMDSLVGRLGFALGKNLAKGKGNVYLRASYLYDFDGETDVAFAKNGIKRNFEQDLGGGWWEVGIGANINLSNTSHLYFDVEKTYGGNVATPWQWNVGMRWSF